MSARTVEVSDYRSQLMLTGSIAARNLINLAFRASGQVIERNVDVGQKVEAGSLLARIDAVDQQAALQSAQASLNAARAQLTQAVANYNRQDVLLKQGFTTRSQFGSAEEAKQRAESALKNAETQMKNAQDMMSYTELRAPRSGVVTARNIEAGQLVQAAQTAYVIAADGDRDAVFDVQEALAAHAETLEERGGLKALPQVSLSLTSDPSIRATGHVREVAPVVNARTGTVRIKVEIDTPPAAMTLGVPVTGSLMLPAIRAIILPWSALTSQQGKPAVWVIDPQTNKVSSRLVDVLDYEREKIIISEGVENGQLVVTRGGQMLGEGAQVDILLLDDQKVAQ
ncbi:efflux RND transporter periplasmic adaptor subunit [Pseudochrobactrum sp. MP213Fo]|uniref:efflux RND transporter periplasmic adaptor subunit n=1 Tax=Pseudochrobactrum sp. MP213Fo TaxID=3022250 RepID=UPI003B9E545F